MIKINGLPAYYGRAQGEVVHVRSQEDLERVNTNSIVVTDKITIEYTEAFLIAAGVISKTGGVTCHAAIVCREQQTPCVVSVEDCFEIFNEGEQVFLDTHKMTFEKS